MTALADIARDPAIDPAPLEAHLHRHPALAAVIAEMAHRILERLPGATLRLSWFEDPESDDAFPVLLVALPHYRDEDLAILEALADEAAAAARRAGAFLLVSTDFEAV